MKDQTISPVRTRGLLSVGTLWLVGAVLWAGATLPACGGLQSNAPAPRAPGAVSPPDGGLPPPASSGRGVIVPSDTGIGSMPSGTGPSTGTAGRGASPILGNPGGDGN